MREATDSSLPLNIGVIDLVFKDAKTAVSIHLPENIHPTEPQKFRFTCLRGPKETHPESLSVTVEQIRNLTIKIGLINIALEIPDALEVGETYDLVVSSCDLPLSARLIKQVKDLRETEEAAFVRFIDQIGKVGKALVSEGITHFARASQGSFSSSREAVEEMMKGVVRATQEMCPEIRVPDTKPPQTQAELDLLPINELQSRFESASKENSVLTASYMGIALCGNAEEMSRLIEKRFANAQLRMCLFEALEKKGAAPEIESEPSECKMQ